jgi:fumarylacetoacetase
MISFVNIDAQSDFSIHNLPFGIFSDDDNNQKRMGVAIGDRVFDLCKAADLGYFDFDGFDEEWIETFAQPFINDFMALGKEITTKIRLEIQKLLLQGSEMQVQQAQVLLPQAAVQMHLPIHIGNYTDFYSSIEHATNVGKLFRPDSPLMPNWKHLPVAYHGRASSIVVSGTDIKRPNGQILPPNAENPIFAPSANMDFELETAFVIGKKSDLGTCITTAQAADYIFGMMLFNDWSARDIQRWEYVPLGPFLGKNFGSTLSAWVVTLDALEPFRCASPVQTPEVLPYLQCPQDFAFDIHLEAYIATDGGMQTLITQSNFKYLYWNMPQQLAHHTCNGCNVQVGDLLASGTISGIEPHSWGSLLELTLGGKQTIKLADGTERKFLQNGDTVILKGFCEKNGVRIGFGEAKGKLV